MVVIMTRSLRILVAFASIACPSLHSSMAWGQANSAPRSLALATTAGLSPLDVKIEAVEYRGRKAIRVTTLPDRGSGLAMIDGTDFRDGTIEAEVATKVTVPPPARMPGFTGIGFRVQREPLHYELFYMRPGNSVGDDQSYRNHSVQYSSEPDFGWAPLRRQWPFIYESYADLEPGAWTKMKIEVHGRRAVLYLNGSAKPALIVDGLKGESLSGGIGLWGFAGEESYFSDLKITPAAPEAIHNGGEIAGAWDVALNTDVGPFKGTAKLSRDGSKVTGAWSGALGEGLPITGSWRDGYVEFAFTATDPKTKEPFLVRFAGWVDEDKASGRVHAVGQSDGRWSATRTK